MSKRCMSAVVPWPQDARAQHTQRLSQKHCHATSCQVRGGYKAAAETRQLPIVATAHLQQDLVLFWCEALLL